MFGCALALLLSTTSLAQEEVQAIDVEQEEMTEAAKKAEYRRLSEELHKLATRNAWTGVERFYKQLEETGVPIQFDELITGAHSARAIGDTKLARTRLVTASKLKEQRDVIEWLWEIDEAYGTVYLACDPDRKKRPELGIKAMPFDPNQAKSVHFAQEQVSENCLFDGMLPGGKYTVGPYNFQVKPKVESVSIDMRAMAEEKPSKKGDGS